MIRLSRRRMCNVASRVRLGPQCPSAAVPSLVSFADAPGFAQASTTTIGKPQQEVPETHVQCYVLPEMVAPQEEDAILRCTAPWFDRVPFADGHMDGLIHHYKEFYRPYDALMNDDRLFSVGEADGAGAGGTLSVLAESTRDRDMQHVRTAIATCFDTAQAYLPHIPLQKRVQFLQLHGDGFIRAHVDESRNSSGIVAGLTLGSARVMSLTHRKFPGKRIDLLLEPRSFYLLCGAARHEWEHSVDWVVDDDEHLQRVRKSHVAEGSEVYFNGKPTGFHRELRTALIFRGVSPMELLMHRMNMRAMNQAPPTQPSSSSS